MPTTGLAQYSNFRTQEKKKESSLIKEYDASTYNSSEIDIFKDKSNFIMFCGPNCQHRHVHNYQYDYSKNYLDPIETRPGIDFFLPPKAKAEAEKVPLDPNACEFGAAQTPIDLSTQMPVMKSFQDKAFEFNYEPVDAKGGQMKFNQSADQFIVDINKGRDETVNPNFLKTQTISLFDQHISEAKLHGLQFHFHAPSEHSIDGKLLDLEMHIVHQMEKKFDPNRNPQRFQSHRDRQYAGIAQFWAGVLGFVFKIMPDSFFRDFQTDIKGHDIEWHDRFLYNLVKDTKEAAAAGLPPPKDLDLKEFVQRLDFNKRWTYAGSLTTAPCDEGILWNVVENVIPIRQDTYDNLTGMRKVEPEQIINPLAKANKKNIDFQEEIKQEVPDDQSCRSQYQYNHQFMRVAGCNRKVQDCGDRPVYRIDCEESEQIQQEAFALKSSAKVENQLQVSPSMAQSDEASQYLGFEPVPYGKASKISAINEQMKNLSFGSEKKFSTPQRK